MKKNINLTEQELKKLLAQEQRKNWAYALGSFTASALLVAVGYGLRF